MPLACFLLALFLVVEHGFRRGRPAAGAGADSALEILVGAKGALLPAASLGSGPERVGDVIRLGERTLVSIPARVGLRSALLAPDRGIESQRTYALARADEEALALDETIAAAREGSLLVLASSGSIAPPGEAGREALGRVTAQLGARARPGGGTAESWAMIALRLEGGWVPLAEGYSEGCGVALAFTLASEIDSYAGFTGDFVRVRAPPESEVLLAEELHHAEVCSAGIEARRPLPAILMKLSHAGDEPRPSSISWSGVELGPGSGFHAWVGQVEGSIPGQDDIAFELWIDGVREKAVVVEPGSTWEPFQVDLRAFSGRRVALELRAIPGPNGRDVVAMWGLPVLFHGYTRPPRMVWPGRR